MYKEDGTDINIAICTSWYLDVEGVKREYKSLNMNDSYAPQYAIFVDGPYTFFKFKDRLTPPLSDDGSREFLQKQSKVVIIDCQGSEVEKRTAYLKKVEELGCHAIIIIDSDEYLHEDFRDWKVFRMWLARYANSHDTMSDGIIFNLMSWIDKDYVKAYNTTEVDQFTLVPRVWHSPKNLEYYNGVHYWVRRKNSSAIGEKLGSTNLTISHGIRIAQDSKLRDKLMLDTRDNCNKNNIKHEDTLIKRYNTANNISFHSIYDRIFGYDDGSITNNTNPLLAITVNHYYPEVIANFKKIINVDKIYLDGFEDRKEALSRARSYFLEHEEYSHLILTSDFVNVQRSDINKLIARMGSGVDIVTGYSLHYDESELKTLLTFSIKKSQDWKTRPEYAYYFMSTTFPLNAFGFWEATHTDLIITGIHRKTLEKNEFDSNIDRGFCWDVTHLGYNILVDPDIYVPMIHDIPVKQFTDNPTLLFEKRHVDIDSFMVD